MTNKCLRQKNEKLSLSRTSSVPRSPSLQSYLRFPHIFIPNSSVPSLSTTVWQMFDRLGSCSTSKICQDDSGYYLFFFDRQDAQESLQRCYHRFNRQILLDHKTEMQVFLKGQQIAKEVGASGRAGANEIEINVKRASIPSAAMPSTPVLTPAHYLQHCDAATSGISSSTPSSTRKCYVCGRVSPLDMTSLVQCAACQRRYHKGCHKPTVSSCDKAWQCSYCDGKKRKRVASPLQHATVASASPSGEAYHPHTKRRKVESARFSSVHTPSDQGGSSPSHNFIACRPLRASRDLMSLMRDGCQMPKQGTFCDTTPKSPQTPEIEPWRATMTSRCLAAKALFGAKDYRLSASDIFQWIEENIPGHERDSNLVVGNEWREEVRDALSSNSSGPNPIFECYQLNDSRECLWALRAGPIDAEYLYTIDVESSNTKKLGWPLVRLHETSSVAITDIGKMATHSSAYPTSDELKPPLTTDTMAKVIRAANKPEFTALSLFEEYPRYCRHAKSPAYAKNTRENPV